MTTKVIQFDNKNNSVKEVLEKAKHLTDIIILGYDKDNNEFYGTSMEHSESILWLLARCKYFIMKNNGD